MKKAIVSLLIVLMAVSAVFAADFEIKIGQGFLPAGTYVPGYEVTSATVAVNNRNFEFGITGSTVFPYAFFKNAFTSDAWAEKWNATTDVAKDYWSVAGYAVFDVVRSEQIDLNIGAEVAYKYSQLATAPAKNVITADAKAEVTFWIADHVGAFAGFECPLFEAAQSDSKWSYKYPNTWEQMKSFLSIAKTTIKAGITVKL